MKGGSFMTHITGENIKLSNYRFTKARAFLKDAELLLKAGSYASSVSLAYFAYHSAVKSLFALKGIATATHEDTQKKFLSEFIEAGLIDQKFGEALQKLKERRLVSDYGDYMEISRNEAEDSLVWARRFIDTAEAVKNKIIESAQRGPITPLNP
jgi:AbiV family abortive infection protein